MKNDFRRSFLSIFVFITLLGAQKNKDSWEELLKTGLLEFDAKNFAAAQELFQKASDHKPESRLLHFNLGVVHYEQGNFELALKEFIHALGDEDKNFVAKVYYSIGNCQYRLGSLEQALDSYKKSLKFNPKDQDAKANLEFVADTLAKRQLSEKAKTAFNEVSKLVAKRLYAEALEILSKTVQDEPAAAEAYQSSLRRLQQLVQIVPAEEKTQI